MSKLKLHNHLRSLFVKLVKGIQLMEAQAGELLLEVLVEELVLLLECGMLLLHLPQKVQPLFQVTLQWQVISLSSSFPYYYTPYYHWPVLLKH